MFTLLGPAGVGKSRLTAEFLASAGESADVLRSRCLHYGEDITYWPLVEILLAIGVEPAEVIGASPGRDAARFPQADRRRGPHDHRFWCWMTSSGPSRSSWT